MKSEKEKMLSGELYDLHDPEIEQMRAQTRPLLDEFNRSGYEQHSKRVSLLKQLLGSTGENIYIEPHFHCDYGTNIHVGEQFYANTGCVILDVAPVHIGAYCLFGPQVGIYTATHPLDPRQRAAGLEYAKAITIGDHCWIGGHVSINPGVTLGNNVVVASGAVVTQSFGDNVLLAGVPARVVRHLEGDESL